jgi:hypothetical protein
MHLRALRGNEEAREAEHMSTLDTVHSLSLLHAEQGFMRNLPIPHKAFERSDSGFHKIGFCTPRFNSNPLNLRGPNFFSFATDSGLLMGDQQIHVFRSTKCREPVGPIFPFGSKAQVHAAIILPLHRTAFLTHCQPVMLSHSILSLPQPHLGMPFPLSGVVSLHTTKSAFPIILHEEPLSCWPSSRPSPSPNVVYLSHLAWWS